MAKILTFFSHVGQKHKNSPHTKMSLFTLYEHASIRILYFDLLFSIFILFNFVILFSVNICIIILKIVTFSSFYMYVGAVVTKQYCVACCC